MLVVLVVTVVVVSVVVVVVDVVAVVVDIVVGALLNNITTAPIDALNAANIKGSKHKHKHEFRVHINFMPLSEIISKYSKWILLIKILTIVFCFDEVLASVLLNIRFDLLIHSENHLSFLVSSSTIDSETVKAYLKVD